MDHNYYLQSDKPMIHLVGDGKEQHMKKEDEYGKSSM